MTRKIKFRGKDILTDKWVYGDLLHLGNAYAIVTSYEEEELKVNPISDRLEIRVEDIAGVYPETVGQLTGQLDKNGKEIYEGDILRFYDEDIPYHVVVVWRDNGFRFVYAHRLRVITSWPIDDMQIFGNIHDTPELLKTETL